MHERLESAADYVELMSYVRTSWVNSTTIMPSKLVIALALSPAAALQLPGVGEVALKLPHKSSVLRDAISQFAAAQSALEAVFRPPPPRAATHSISDVRKRGIQEGRARPRRALARTKIQQQM